MEQDRSMAEALMAAGRWGAASVHLRAALLREPGAVGLRGLLGVALLHGEGDAVAAEPHLRAAVAADPGDAESRLHLATVCAQRGDPAEAVALLDGVLLSQPDHAAAQHNRAVALGALGRLRESAEAWSRLTVLCPDDVAAWIGAGMAWLAVGAPHPAHHALTQAVALRPRLPGVLARLGALSLDLGNLAEADGHFAAALALQPDQRHALVGLARLRLRRRDEPGARALVAPLLERHAHEPEVAALWSELCRRQGDPRAALPALQAALAAADSQSARGLILHRIADVLDAAGDPDAAMDAWDAANAAERQAFDPVAHAAAVQALAAAYTRPSRPLARATVADPLPVFIVGMPRSGSSLLEQMLDRHPLVRGLGEREEIRQIASGLPHRLGVAAGGGDYFHHLGRLTPAVLDALAEGHRARLRALAGPGVTRAIDKMPHNFLHLGLIGQFLPGARAIWCVRDPVDTCFSCYRQRFSAGLPYTTRLDWLGAFYRTHEALMAVWSRLQPVPILRVDYAALVTQPEPVLRAVLGFLELPWHPDCLAFHRSTRDVGTASHSQVQRPLYTSSVGRAAPYRHRLGALCAALANDPAGYRQPERLSSGHHAPDDRRHL